MTTFKESTLSVRTYETKFRGQKFFIDIVEFSEHQHEAWIYTDRMGVKDLMFGNGYCNEGEFTSLAFCNFEEHAEIYLKNNH